MTTRIVTVLRSGRIAKRWIGFIASAGLAGIAQGQPAVSTPFSYGVTTNFSYRTDGVYSGQLSTTTTMSDVLASCTLKTFDFDTHGNNASTKLQNCAGAPASAAFTTRLTTLRYDPVASQPITVANGTVLVSLPGGSVPTSATNAAGQTTTRQIDPRFAAPLQQTDINGQTSYQVLDDFGRLTVRELPDGTSLATRYCILAAAGLDLSSNSPGCATPATSEAPVDAVMFTQSQPMDAGGQVMGAWTRIYTDRLDRGIRVVTQGYDGPSQGASSGGLVVADTVYGLAGQIVLTSDPHFLANGSTSTEGSNDVRVTSHDYDALGRAVTVAVSDPMGHGGSVDFSRNGQTGYGQLTAAVSRVSYNGLSTTMANDLGQQRVEERDPFKQLVRVTDANGAQLSTLYDAFGNVVKTQDALGNVTSYVFDAKGDELQRNDPDKGLTVLTYDALGQVTTSQNANEAAWGTRTTLAYDVMGRVSSRITSEYQSTWTYDTCANGVGSLCSVSSTNQVRKDYSYDARGRLSIKLVSSPSLSLPEAFAYDSVTGRLSTRTYPTGLQVRLNYTVLGYASELRLVTAASVAPLPHTVGGVAGTSGSLLTNSLLWSNDVVNAAGGSERQSYGNGVVTTTGYQPFSGRLSMRSATGAKGLVTSQSYSWNSLNNLVGRSESAPGPNALSETFSYGDPVHGDNLQRLSGYTVADPDMAGLSRTVSLGYNALGELLFKSDVGNYGYGANGGAHPHAVQTVSGATNDLFTYDARGNVTGGGNGRFSGIKYTSFDLPDSTQGITGAPAQPHYTWQYGEDNARVTQTRRVLSSDGVHDDVRTTWYDNPDNAGGLSFEYEIDQPAAANTLMRNVAESRHFLTIGGQPIGVLISEGVLGSTAVTPPVISSIALTKVEYWNQDHLGSIVATTDHTAAVTARYSYDPFGKRRANSGAYDASGAVLADWSTVVDNGTARGFTGHEHLDDIGLIQMNGRIFEPTLGVFLQGDTSVPHPQDLQSFHRYAYCRNNPMGCSDPTGMVDSPPQTVDITGTSPGGSPGRGIFGGQIADPGHDHNGRGARTILVTPTGTNISYKVVIPAEKESTAGTAQTPIVLVVIPGTNQAVPVAELMNSLGVTNPQDLVAVLNAMADAKGKVSIVAAGGAATAAAESRFGSSVLSALGRVVGWGVESAEFATLVVLSPLLLSGDTDRTQAAALNSAAQATATQSDTKRDSLTWYHYTDQAGLSAIMASGGTLVANNGRVYGSPLPMSPQDANTTLFIGGPPGFEKKGQYVVAFKFNDPYMTMVPSAKPGEFFYPGSLRDGRQITITSAGPNPFGASK